MYNFLTKPIYNIEKLFMAKLKDEIETASPIKYKIGLKCKNAKQKELVKTIKNNEITFCTGSAGTGKSYVTLATALDLLQKDNEYQKIIILCNATESDDKSLGFLKGSLEEKLFPYAYPHLYTMGKIISNGNKETNGADVIKQMKKDGRIEIMSVTFLRGLTIDNAIVVIEEAQNLSKASCKTILTRIGDNCKYIFDGDLEQIDNKELRKNKDNCGLKHSMDRLKDIDGVGVIEFTKEEIVRNPIITKILDNWE